jgi:chitinase
MKMIFSGKVLFAFFLLGNCFFWGCVSNPVTQEGQQEQEQARSFKVIGYYASWGPAPEELDLTGLTHLNYSFALPAKEGNGLQDINNSDRLRKLVEIGHQNGQKVFIALGGWNLGDGGGDDSRFHRMAETEAGRQTFVEEVMAMVDTYNLDGVDMDWEYPDADASADHFVSLMQLLADALHEQGKELSAAVISYNDRVGAGIKNEVFQTADWINIMAYDDEKSQPQPNPHSPFSLAEKSLNYWIDQRGLPAEKAVLGLPYYGKPGYISFKKLLEQGANPAEDVHDEVFYNGTETIKAKTRLALQRDCAGVMIWEISQDVKGPNSLTKAINEAISQPTVQH